MIATRLILIACFTATAPQRATGIGAILEPGMQLIYSSDAIQSPPWTIDSIVRDRTLGGRAGCIRIRLRTTPAQAVPDSRAHCTDSTTMFNWDERTGQLRPARPVKAGAVLDIPNRSGGSTRFETSAVIIEWIRLECATPDEAPARIPVEVIRTVATTVDSTGAVVRRLRERFSVGLATATGGVFEVPDSSQKSGWRTVRAFELVVIRLP